MLNAPMPQKKDNFFSLLNAIIELHNFHKNSTPKQNTNLDLNLRLTAQAEDNANKAKELYTIISDSFTGKEIALKKSLLDEIVINSKASHTIDCYQLLLPIMELSYLYEEKGIATVHAQKLTDLFGTFEKTLDYLVRFANRNKQSAHIIYDSCLFQFPEEKINIDFWRQLGKKENYNLEFMKLLPHAAKIENLLKSNLDAAQPSKQKATLIKENAQRNAKKAEIRTSIKNWKNLKNKRVKQKGLSSDEEKEYQAGPGVISTLKLELYELCVGIDLTKTDLCILQAFQEKIRMSTDNGYPFFLKNGIKRSDYERFLECDRNQAGIEIPNVTIDGATIGHPGFYFRKLNVQNEDEAVLAACLGKLTNCCQSFSGELGEPCVIHGLTDPKGGFFVLCQGDINHPSIHDKVIAQSWAWLSQNNALVFDSVEGFKFLPMIRNFYRALAFQITSNEELLIDKVAYSYSMSFLNLGISDYVPHNKVLETPVNYSGYREPSINQCTLSLKKMPFLQLEIDVLERKAADITIKLIKVITSTPTPLQNNSDLQFMIQHIVSNNDNKLLELFKNNFKNQEQIIALINSAKEYVSDLNKGKIRLDLIKSAGCINFYNQNGETALMLAAKNKNAKIITQLLQLGPDINFTDDFGNTALLNAAQNGSKTICKKLIAYGADINIVRPGSTILTLAVMHDWPDLCHILLNKGFNVNSDLQALAYAANNGNNELCMLLLENGANVNSRAVMFDRRMKFGSALMLSLKMDLKEVSLKLIEEGANVNFSGISTYGKTPLMCAAKSKNSAACLKLLEKGAKIDTENARGETIWDFAVKKELFDVCFALVDKGVDINSVVDGKNVLMYAAKSGNVNACLTLIEKGANIHFIDYYGENLLMHAAKSGNVNVCSTLIEKGANIHSIDNYGENSLMHAAKSGNVNVCLTLIEKGADINSVDNSGMTPLMHAAWNGNDSVCDQLILKKANIDARSKKGKTALMYAAENERSDICMKLIEAGANENCIDKKNKTALSYSAKACHAQSLNSASSDESEISSNFCNDSSSDCDYYSDMSSNSNDDDDSAPEISNDFVEQVLANRAKTILNRNKLLQSMELSQPKSRDNKLTLKRKERDYPQEDSQPRKKKQKISHSWCSVM